MNRRDFLKTAGFGVSTFLFPTGLGAGIQSAAEKCARPHVIFILADDMGYGDLACQNPESKISTPNLDRLAKEGIRFTDAHSPSAVCTPTRYGLLTGRYAWRTELKSGVLWPWDRPLIEPDRMTAGHLMKEAGYHTACIGKWHLGWDWPTRDGTRINDILPVGRYDKKKRAAFNSGIDLSKRITGGPLSRGFDYYFGDDVPNFPPYCFIENDHVTEQPTEEKPKSFFGHAGMMAKDWRLDGVMPSITKKACEYIERQSLDPADQPFFLYFSLTAPHTPIAPAKEFQGKSRAGAYGDYVYQVDHTVGDILKTLDRCNIRDNTLIIFTSDNGSPGRDGSDMNGEINSVRAFGHNPSRPWRGIKSDVWDGGHRVPFLARWPGHIPAGITCPEPICHVDLLATLAALVGVKLKNNAGEDSYNLLPVLTGQTAKEPLREAIVHHSGSGLFAVRRGKWKLILGLGPGGFSGPIRKPRSGEPEGQLYDIQADPREKKNLYALHPEVVEELSNLLERYKTSGRSVPETTSP